MQDWLSVPRSLVYNLGYFTALVLLGALATLLRPLQLKSETNYRLLMWYAPLLIRWARASMGVRYKVLGLEHLPSTNCVVLSNHQSAWETFFLASLLTPNSSLLKKELLEMPFFGKALAMVEPIAIERDKPTLALKQLIQQGKDRLDRGRWVIVYPEGTRVAPGEKVDFSPGGVLLAMKAGVDIVPIAHNAGTVWKNGGLRQTAGEITVVVGPPIAVANKSRDELLQETETWIRSTLAKLGDGSDCRDMGACRT